MVNKISKLTNAQKAEIPGWAEKWRKIGLSTEPADRPRAEAAFARAYRKIGKEPARVLWVGSPVAAHLTLIIIERLGWNPTAEAMDRLHDWLSRDREDRFLDRLWEEIMEHTGHKSRNQVWSQMRDQLWRHIRTHHGNSIHLQIKSHGGTDGALRLNILQRLVHEINKAGRWQFDSEAAQQINKLLGDQLCVHLNDQIWQKIGGQLRDQFRGQPIKYYGDYLWGQHDLYWVAYHLFCKYIGVEYTKDQSDSLDILHEIGLSCMWWWPHENFIVACDRPAEIHLTVSDDCIAKSGLRSGFVMGMVSMR